MTLANKDRKKNLGNKQMDQNRGRVNTFKAGNSQLKCQKKEHMQKGQKERAVSEM